MRKDHLTKSERKEHKNFRKNRKNRKGQWVPAT